MNITILFPSHWTADDARWVLHQHALTDYSWIGAAKVLATLQPGQAIPAIPAPVVVEVAA